MQQTATAAFPARTWQAAYPGRADQLWHVRAALRPQLRGCPVADEVLLLASELAANAIAHSDSGQPGGTFTIRLHRHRDHIRAEVQDAGSTWDGDLAGSARHPHGLYLLLTLSTQCGIDPGPHSQTAWFRIDYPPPPATSRQPPGAVRPRTAATRNTPRLARPPQPPEGPADDHATPPPHPLTALTPHELSRSRRELEHALKALPGHAPARPLLQQRLAEVIAEQHSRTQAPASGQA